MGVDASVGQVRETPDAVPTPVGEHDVGDAGPVPEPGPLVDQGCGRVQGWVGQSEPVASERDGSAESRSPMPVSTTTTRSLTSTTRHRHTKNGAPHSRSKFAGSGWRVPTLS